MSAEDRRVYWISQMGKSCADVTVRIVEMEAALYAALDGREVVIREGDGGHLERTVLEDGGIMWRRLYIRKG